jgi:hypothetical protein
MKITEAAKNKRQKDKRRILTYATKEAYTQQAAKENSGLEEENGAAVGTAAKENSGLEEELPAFIEAAEAVVSAVEVITKNPLDYFIQVFFATY